MVRSLLVGQQEQLLARPAVDFAVQMMVPITVSPPLSLRNHHRGERTRGRSETIDVDFTDTFEDDFGETMQTGCADYPPSWAYHCPAGFVSSLAARRVWAESTFLSVQFFGENESTVRNEN